MGVPPSHGHHRRRWPGIVPLLVTLVVVAEIAFLGRLDMAKNVAALQQWTSSVYFPSLSSQSSSDAYARDIGGGGGGGGGSDAGGSSSSWMPLPVPVGKEELSCVEWLEREDNVSYSRDFRKDPILVAGANQDWSSCSVGCKFGNLANKIPDAAFGFPQNPTTAGVLRSMESSHYYSENNIDLARRRGYKVVMTTSLSSDVPVGYFSWAEYDIMAPMLPKTEEALAAAFISNCGARNFRLQALEMLETLNVKIDSYGSCHRNRDGNVDKVSTLKRYKFSLAFENSNEEDYVTEKFFQSLVAGAVPVVIGAPNIRDFAPSLSSVLHIKELGDVALVAKTMKQLGANPDAYNQSVRWKYEGPSDSFKALVDMAAVHSSCRLCIHIATQIQRKEERAARFGKRPCKCTNSRGTIHHLYVRERGRFAMESIYLRSGMLTLEALESAVLAKFRSLHHTPIWKKERPESIRAANELKVYRIYPLGLTQRQALYTFRFKDDAELQMHIEANPCAKFEVIFV